MTTKNVKSQSTVTPTQPPALHDDLRAGLPPLPEPEWNSNPDMYSTSQMRDYAIAALSAIPAIRSGDMGAWLGKLGALVSAAKDRDLSAGDHAAAIGKAHSELFNALHALSTPPAAVSQPAAMAEGWQPIESAPLDRLVLLALANDESREHAIDDTADLSRTVGEWDENDECWRFAGWCWSHDHFTQGSGTPVLWAELPGIPRADLLSAGAVQGGAG